MVEILADSIVSTEMQRDGEVACFFLVLVSCTSMDPFVLLPSPDEDVAGEVRRSRAQHAALGV